MIDNQLQGPTLQRIGIASSIGTLPKPIDNGGKAKVAGSFNFCNGKMLLLVNKLWKYCIQEHGDIWDWYTIRFPFASEKSALVSVLSRVEIEFSLPDEAILNCRKFTFQHSPKIT